MKYNHPKITLFLNTLRSKSSSSLLLVYPCVSQFPLEIFFHTNVIILMRSRLFEAQYNWLSAFFALSLKDKGRMDCESSNEIRRIALSCRQSLLKLLWNLDSLLDASLL